MKTILAINGSPRPKSNSNRMLDLFSDAGAGYGLKTEKITLADHGFQMCQGCLACFKTGQCRHDDGLNALMKKVEAADGLVLVSPVYYGSVTAQMKTFMDRVGLLSESHKRSLRGKVAGAMTVARRWGHLSAMTQMLLFFDRVEMLHVGCGWCAATSTNANDISSDAEGLDYPRRLAENMARVWDPTGVP